MRSQNQNNICNPKSPHQVSQNNVEKSNDRNIRKLKVQFIPNNPNGQPNNFNLQINPKTLPDLKAYDILEISSINQSNYGIQLNNHNLANRNNPNVYAHSINSPSYNQQKNMVNEEGQYDDENSPILLQVVPASLNEQIALDKIIIDQIASSAPFNFRPLANAHVQIVDRSNVVLDLVELSFKEQYYNGNDMLRFKKYMVNTCVYLKKNIEFCGMRCSVRDMWLPNGDIVTCGYIGEKTRLVFRAQSAMCTIYIQMSREMWEFDTNGEMYHEKAVNFLGELFTNWKNQACSHDVTIALFSRIYYEAKSIDEFPSSVSGYIQDNKGENKGNKSRFYEDFYRVIYQNERFEDWNPTLVILKRLIKEYRDYILNYHRRQFGSSLKMPAGVLSSAAEGNFLETLILSSSVFERHFIDRPFDRTGMMSLVITPGNGLFKVSRKLSKITKDRVLDNAIGSDLVCLGEQPLHSVPLFKYESSDDYGVPHWINLSFYKSSETVRFCNSKFLPSSKIKVKQKYFKITDSEAILPDYSPGSEETNYQKSLEDTDNMFVNKPSKNAHSDSLIVTKKASSRVNTMTNFQKSSQFNQNTSGRGSEFTAYQNSKRSTPSFNGSSNQMGNSYTDSQNTSTSIKRSVHSMSSGFDEISLQSTSTIQTPMKETSHSKAEDDQNGDSSFEFDSDLDTASHDVNGSSSSIYKHVSNKVNPFRPSSYKHRMSFERRRWAHAFHLNAEGEPVYEHVKKFQAQSENDNLLTYANSNDVIKNDSPDSKRINGSQYNSRNLSRISENSHNKNLKTSKNSMMDDKLTDLKSNNNWEELNKNESKAFMKPGVAWKSLTTPACLPLTTDFFPNKIIWESKFFKVSDYSLLHDEIREEYSYPKSLDNIIKISMEQVFYELVGHRLAMGFQIVVPKGTYPAKNSLITTSNDASSWSIGNSGSNPNSDKLELPAGINKKSIKGYYKLSLGRIYHELFYIVDVDETREDHQKYIKVSIYTPKQKFLAEKEKENYWYRFQVPDSKTYDISYIKMTRQSMESIKWNLIDSYICIQGAGSLTPSMLQKCWRQRIYLIPVMYTSTKPGNKQNLTTDSSSTSQKSTCQSEKSNDGSLKSSQTSPKNNITGTDLPDSSLFIYNIQAAGIIPASMLEDQIVPVFCDIYQRKSIEELNFFRDYYFIKFMEGLNKLNRAEPDRRFYSKAALAYSEMVNNQSINLNDQSIAVSVIMNSLSTNSNTFVNTNQPINLSSSQKLANTLNIPKNIQSSCQNLKNLVSPKVKLHGLLSKLWSCEAKSDSTNMDSSEHHALKNEIITYLNTEYTAYMISSNGIPFFENKNDIPLNCFISAESVWWCIEHIVDIDTESEAIDFMQIMCDFDLIRHISNQPRITKPQKIFVHGFNLYYIINENTRDHNHYTKDYCEVGFCDLDYKIQEKNKESANSKLLVSVENLIPKSKTNLPVAATELYESYASLLSKHSKTQFADTSPDSILKLVNVDVDPSRKSNRNEWASAVYRSHFHQLCAFELEIQWEMATGQLLAELLNYWAKLATRFNYHIVAAPIDPFALPIVQNSDPLRGPIIVKLNFQCLIQNEKILFENYIDKVYKLLNYDSEKTRDDFKLESGTSVSSTCSFSIMDQLTDHNPEFMSFLFKKHSEKSSIIIREFKVREILERKIQEDPEFIENEFHEFIERKRIFRLQYFQEAILEKFGFVRNAAIVKTLYSDEDPTFFIHSSGGMFVCLPNYYANYYTNRSRHTSSNSTNSITMTTASSVARSTLNIKNATDQFSPIAFNNHSIGKNSEMQSNSPIVTDNLKTPINQINPTNSNSSNYSISNNPITSSGTRERSNTKSQHTQFLKINNFHYLNGNWTEDNNESDKDKTEEVKNDLLFRPKTTDLRLSTKSNEKLDLIQQQQREQMLLQSTTPTQPSHLEHHLSSSASNNDSCILLNNQDPSVPKKIPFYAEPDTYIGFSWSWNFMLGKRWRSQYTGDETFQDNMLADFKLFCSNKDGRLLKFFNESKEFLN